MPESQEELEHAIRDNTEAIGSASMPFPISTKLTLTRRKLIYEKESGLTKRVYSIDPRDIRNVTASIGTVFGLVYLSHDDPDFPKQVGWFWRKDTIKMKRLIDGYVLATRQNINVHDIEIATLIPLLIKLGTDDPSIKR